MMISPDRDAIFIEVCKTGSTAAARYLREHGWVQNSSLKPRIISTDAGRHSFLTEETMPHIRGMRTYGVVRNPWDRMASLWRASCPSHKPFWTFLNRGRFRLGPADALHFQQVNWLYGVEHVIRYETLNDDWQRLADKYGDLPSLPKGGLPVVNKSKDRRTPQWTRRERDLIARRFADDIATFGYKEPS